MSNATDVQRLVEVAEIILKRWTLERSEKGEDTYFPGAGLFDALSVALEPFAERAEVAQ